MDMGNELVIQIMLLLVLIMVNAIFAASEIAIVSSNRGRVERLAKEGNKPAQKLVSFIDEPSQFLATIQIGITLAGFMASASAATTLAAYVSPILLTIGLSAAISNQLAVVLITLVLAYLTLVFGELYPKRIGMQQAERLALKTVSGIALLAKIFRPIVWLLTKSTDLLMVMTRQEKTTPEQLQTYEQLQLILDTIEQGVFTNEQREQFRDLVAFQEKQLDEVMLARADVVFLNLDDPIETIFDQIKKAKATRFPVYRGDIDEIIGFLYVKDMYYYMLEHVQTALPSIPWGALLRKPVFFVEHNFAHDALHQLQQQGAHMAAVIDESGGVSGVVTMELLAQAIIGESFEEEEHSRDEVQRISRFTYLIDGATPLEEINKKFDLALKSAHVVTIGGYLSEKLGHLPVVSEIVKLPQDRIVIQAVTVEQHRVETVKLTVLKKTHT